MVKFGRHPLVAILATVATLMVTAGVWVKLTEPVGGLEAGIAGPREVDRGKDVGYQVMFTNKGRSALTIYGLKFLCFDEGCVDFFGSDKLDRRVLRGGKSRMIPANVSIRSLTDTFRVTYPVYHSIPGGKMIRLNLNFEGSIRTPAITSE